MHKCTNAEPGTYGHECSKPATWTGTDTKGNSAEFCDECRRTGFEARNYSQWTPTEKEPAA